MQAQLGKSLLAMKAQATAGRFDRHANQATYLVNVLKQVTLLHVLVQRPCAGGIGPRVLFDFFVSVFYFLFNRSLIPFYFLFNPF